MKLVLKSFLLVTGSAFFLAGLVVIILAAENVTGILLCILIGVVCLGSVYIVSAIEKK